MHRCYRPFAYGRRERSCRPRPRILKVAIIGDSHACRIRSHNRHLNRGDSYISPYNNQYRVYARGGLTMDKVWDLMGMTSIHQFNPDVCVVHVGACDLLPKHLSSDAKLKHAVKFERRLRQLFKKCLVSMLVLFANKFKRRFNQSEIIMFCSGWSCLCYLCVEGVCYACLSFWIIILHMFLNWKS